MALRVRSLLAATAVATTVLLSFAARADDDSDRVARWNELRQTIFGSKTLAADNLVKLDAPERAQDASLVPVTLSVPSSSMIKSEWLVIDENPSPLAAHFTFGPAADPAKLSMRVRVDSYTNFHAIVETEDGKLHETGRFVKAAGGCSAPVGMSEDEAMQGIGFMRLRVRGEPATGKPVPVTLMVWHPNFNGMQMNPVTRNYTPARYIRTLDVTYNGKLVFHMDGDISIASNPVIDFAVIAADKGRVDVVAEDSQKGRWEHSFALPVQTN